MSDALAHALTPEAAIKLATVATLYRQQFPDTFVNFAPRSEELGFGKFEVVFSFDRPFAPGYVTLAIVLNVDTGELESVDIDCVGNESDLDWEPSFYIYEGEGSYWVGAMTPPHADKFVRIAQQVYELFEGYCLPAQIEGVEKP